MKAPSLIRVNSQGIKNKNLPSKATVQSRRPKHMTNVMETTKEYNTAENLKMKPFTRGPRQSSFRGTVSKAKQFANTEEQAKTANHQMKEEATSKNSKAIFQRSLSFCKPSSSSEKIFFNKSRRSLSGTEKTGVLTKNENTGKNQRSVQIRISSSQNDLNSEPISSNKSHCLRMTPSVSTSSIPSEVSYIKY